MGFAAVRIPLVDKDLWHTAALIRGISQSAFLREVLRNAAVRTIETARVMETAPPESGSSK
jgi:hypothetical protein